MSQSRPITHCEPLALFEESTVVAEFVRERDADNAYQSEAALEKAFIKQLQAQAYEYLPITSEAELVANLRRQLEKLNGMTFSDAEWETFFSTCIAGNNDGIIEKTTRIQEDHIQILKRDDGSTKISICSTSNAFTTTACKSSINMKRWGTTPTAMM